MLKRLRRRLLRHMSAAQLRLRRKLDLPSHRVRRALLPRAFRSRRVPRLYKGVGEAATRTLFIDLAVISSHDAGTGIQRVVRALALALPRQPSDGWDIQFVAATRTSRYHRITWPEQDKPEDLNLIPIRARPGDVFVGLDYSLDTIRWHRAQLARFRRRGGALWFLVHDVLPIRQPDWFSPQTVLKYRIWMDILASLADGFFCNSSQTEEELLSELQRYGPADGRYRTCVLPMGSDIGESIPNTQPQNSTSNARIGMLASVPYFLKVGTLEPRKGHSDLIRAFELLWASGLDQRLVLIGRLGWSIEALHNSILSHPEFGKRLIWLDDVDDASLIEAYRTSIGVFVTSHAEGFGLPLIEALGHGKPVLARDLPVFRQHESHGVQFFPADATPALLAARIVQWDAAIRNGDIVVRPPQTDWKESARRLLAALRA